MRFLRRPLKTLRRLLVYALTRLAMAGILALPDRLAVQTGAALGATAFGLLAKYRRRCLKNLALAFGDELDDRGRRTLAREVFRNCGRAAAEFALLRRWNKQTLEKKVAFQGVEHILAEIKRGKGVIVVGAHFGNWELGAAASVQHVGVPFGAVAARLSNPWMDRLLNRRRQANGFLVLPRGGDGRELIRHLKGGGILVVLGDQDTRRGAGVFVPFFGRPAHTQRGPAFLAWRFQAPIIPFFMVRNPDGFTHTMCFEPPIRPPETGDAEQAVESLARAYTEVIERYVRRYPAQWMWMHDRWRQQPSDKPPRLHGARRARG